MKNLKIFLAFTGLIMFAAAITMALGIPFFVAATVLFLLSLFTPNLKGTLNSVVSNPLIGHAKQKIGNVVFSTWKGIDVLKTKPLSVAQPPSDRRTAQQSALRQMVLAFRRMPGAIDAGFKKLAVKMSQWNAFASYNLKNAFDFSVPGVATIVPSDVLISKGTIAPTIMLTDVGDVSLATIAATYAATATDPGQSVDDVAIIAAHNPTADEWTGDIAAGTRGDGTASIPLPAGWNAGDIITVYLGFYNPLSGNSSDSVNLGSTIVA